MRKFYAVLIIILGLCLTLSTAAKPKLELYTEMDPINQTQSPLYTGTIKLVETAGYSYTIHSSPWIRTFNQALINDHGLVFPIYQSAERLALFHWFCPIAPGRDIYLFRLSNHPIHISTLKQAKRYSVGVIKSSVIHDYLVNHDFNSEENLDLTAYDKTNLVKLLNNRVDFIAQSQERLYELMHQLNLPFDTLTREYLIFDHQKFPLCAAANLNIPEKVLKDLNRAFNKITAHHSARKKNTKDPFAQCNELHSG